MSIVAIKNLIFPSSRPRPSDEESRIRAPLITVTSPPPRDYSALETDFTTQRPHRPGSPARYNSDFSKTDCPVYNCPRRRPIHRRHDEDEDNNPAGHENGHSKWLSPRAVSDAIIGLSDGLTVPFALTAGLSAFNDTRVVLYGGMAELIAGSISMGLGGWLAGRGEAQYYTTTLQSTRTLVQTSPAAATDLIYRVFDPYHLPNCAVSPLIASLLADSTAMVDFLMSFHHSLPPPSDTKRTPLTSALTIAAGYFLGGAIPLLPYFFVGREEVMTGLYASVGTMAICLFIFGVIRTILVGEEEVGDAGKSWFGRVKGGMEMMAVGGVAAGASWAIVRALEVGQK
ncbi:DUF125-domain-containing protein [Ascodesmis nigricans]|uniref:DUF125-domain-containing protein n=1 Tax=Ascodesmis nigricans TaxID=341454 RepID=A0A4S2MXB3_9PEZI|nr:DUF125-domain-containing protein [Ascodesmis nigricans]